MFRIKKENPNYKKISESDKLTLELIEEALNELNKAPNQRKYNLMTGTQGVKMLDKAIADLMREEFGKLNK